MKPHEEIPCEDGSSISLTTAKLEAERVLDDMMGQLRQAVLQGTSQCVDRAWAAFNPIDRKPKSVDEGLAEIRSGIQLAFLLGISHALQLTLSKLSR